MAPAISSNYSRAGVVVNFVTATGGDVEMLRSIECYYKLSNLISRFWDLYLLYLSPFRIKCVSFTIDIRFLLNVFATARSSYESPRHCLNINFIPLTCILTVQLNIFMSSAVLDELRYRLGVLYPYTAPTLLLFQMFLLLSPIVVFIVALQRYVAKSGLNHPVFVVELVLELLIQNQMHF